MARVTSESLDQQPLSGTPPAALPGGEVLAAPTPRPLVLGVQGLMPQAELQAELTPALPARFGLCISHGDDSGAPSKDGGSCLICCCQE